MVEIQAMLYQVNIRNGALRRPLDHIFLFNNTASSKCSEQAETYERCLHNNQFWTPTRSSQNVLKLLERMNVLNKQFRYYPYEEPLSADAAGTVVNWVGKEQASQQRRHRRLDDRP